MFNEKRAILMKEYEELLNKKNTKDTTFYNGIYDRWVNPVLTRNHIPYFWKYDMIAAEGQHRGGVFLRNRGVNAAFDCNAEIIQTFGHSCMILTHGTAFDYCNFFCLW